MLCSTPSTAAIADGYAKISSDLTIHYQETGAGDIAVVFVPGWTMTTEVYQHQLSHFDQSTKFRAITFDPRAQGLTSITMDGHYYAQRADDLRQLLAKLGCQRVVLVGWSAGGGDVLEYVRLFGAEKLVGLVLIDTTPKSHGFDDKKEWIWFGVKDNGDQDGQFKFFSYDLMLDRHAANVVFAKWMLENPTENNIRFVESMSNHTPTSIAALLNTSYWFLDDSDVLASLNGKIPLLYVTRKEWGPLASTWAEANSPAAKVISFGKHMMFWERPKQFNAVIDTYLAGIN